MERRKSGVARRLLSGYDRATGKLSCDTCGRIGPTAPWSYANGVIVAMCPACHRSGIERLGHAMDGGNDMALTPAEVGALADRATVWARFPGDAGPVRVEVSTGRRPGVYAYLPADPRELPPPESGRLAAQGVVVWRADPRPGCHVQRDGACYWPACPQGRDGEPMRSGRGCPIATDADRDG